MKNYQQDTPKRRDRCLLLSEGVSPVTADTDRARFLGFRVVSWLRVAISSSQPALFFHIPTHSTRRAGPTTNEKTTAGPALQECVLLVVFHRPPALVTDSAEKQSGRQNSGQLGHDRYWWHNRHDPTWGKLPACN